MIHITNSYVLAEKTKEYPVSPGFSDYIRFFRFLKEEHYDIAHIHAVHTETFAIYALIAHLQGLKVVLTLHTPITFSYRHIIVQLFTRFLYNHIVCTSRYLIEQVQKHHIASRYVRSLIYQGIDQKKIDESPSKEFARSYIYKKIGISFTKNIRIVGTIADESNNNGLEHLADAAYLADTYKNLTNTIFVILGRGKVSADIKLQVADIAVEGIYFIIEDVENPEEYIKAFDIFVSPRTAPGDLYTLLHVLHTDIPCIATKVADTREFEPHVAVPLVPPGSAKYLTEALMYVIKHDKPAVFKAGIKVSPLPKKFTKDHERLMLQEAYQKVLKK